MFYWSDVEWNFWILFHHKTGRKRSLLFLCGKKKKKELKLWVFVASGKRHLQRIYPLSQAKETNVDWGSSFLLVVGSNRVYGRCGFSLEKNHPVQYQCREKCGDIKLVWGSSIKPCTMSVSFSVRLTSQQRLHQVKFLHTDYIYWFSGVQSGGPSRLITLFWLWIQPNVFHRSPRISCCSPLSTKAKMKRSLAVFAFMSETYRSNRTAVEDPLFITVDACCCIVFDP